MSFKKEILLVFFISAFMLNGPIPATIEAQQDYPSRPLKMYIPFDPGGSTDLFSRALADAASKILKQPIEPLNKAGGGGTLSTATVAKAKPDGYSIGVVSATALCIAPHLRSLPYHPLQDLTPILQFANYASALGVKADSPYKTWDDLMQEARKSPGAVTYGTSGAGSVGHIIMEQITRMEKIKLTHVPFAGGNPALAAVLGGHTTAIMATEFLSHAKAGKLRVLAIVGEKRFAELPEVPTFLELKYPLKLGLYGGIIGPKGLPPAIVNKLEQVFQEAAKDEAFKTVMNNFLMAVTIRNSSEFRELITATYNEYGIVLKDLGIAKQ
jgi:tripartite-type tricarboxylate transporter receptor subunit TctC